MRLPERLGLAILLAVCLTTAGAAQTPAATQVDTALQELRRDPELASERTVNVPEWVGPVWKADDESQGSQGPFARAIAAVLKFLFGAGRWLLFTLLIIVFALLALYILRNASLRASWRRDASALLPTHVRDLDVRPESLPDDIGGAAWRLWEQGETRAALSLLYRGLLSRMVYQYAVPVRDSSTEGDCRQLCVNHLAEAQRPYAVGLIDVWQLATYGARTPAALQVRELCSHFDAVLPLKAAV